MFAFYDAEFTRLSLIQCSLCSIFFTLISLFMKIFFSGVLKEAVEAVKVGASVRELCSNADKRLEEETGKAFKKDKKLVKGDSGSDFMTYSYSVIHC